MLARRTEYAIRALVYISLQNRKERIPLIPEICREIEAPQAFTAKILQTLSRQRLVSSLKGRGGGFFFDDQNRDIRLYDVIYALQGDGLFVNCGFGLKNCSDTNPCPLHEEYKIVRDNYYRIVKDETIASLSQKIFEGKAVLNNLNRVTNLKTRKMAIKKVWIEEGCTACGLCEDLCPDVFVLNDEAEVIEGADLGSNEDCIIESAESCPVEVIKFEEE